MLEQVVVPCSRLRAAGGDGGVQELENESDEGDSEEEEEAAVCSLNIDGDEMILFPSSVIVDDERNALEMVLEEAHHNNQPARGFKWKFICCLYAIISLTCTLSDVALTSYMCLKKANVMVAEFHTGWDFEGPLLVAQALLAVTFSTFATQVVIRGMRISTRVYFSCLAGLVLVISIIFGWIFKEDTHGHELKDMSKALKYLRRRIQRYIRFHEQQSPPAWLQDFQRESRCCGLEDIYDWKSLWGKPDVPDSCCSQASYDGCGKDFFHNDTAGGPEGVYMTGCIHSKEAFTPTHLMVLEQIKFIEAFFMIFVTLVWLCCWDKFITGRDQEILLRYVPPANEQRLEWVTERRRRYDEGCEEEAQGVRETVELRPVESRDDSRQGAGDLGRKSEDTLRPKTQENNYQSGDYTDIDPTKAATIAEIIVESNLKVKK